jgi:response regulator RpfG family c-di-GMP phosphodiesterase
VTVPDNGKILLVDDDPKLAYILCAHLTAAGHDVTSVGDAETALERARTFRPDLVVMDVGLPGMDGIEATRRLKNDRETADTAVIMLTARSDSDHVVMALEAGAQEYVVKPFDVAELLARIRTVLRLTRTKRELDDLNGRLVSEVESRTSRLRVLYNFTRALNEAQTENEILDLILTTVGEVTGSRRVSVLLKAPDGQHLECKRASGIAPSVVKRIRVRYTDGIAGRVFTTGKTFVGGAYNNYRAADGPNATSDGEAFVSTPLIATSIMTREERLGVLSITEKNGGGEFSAEEIECIHSIADSGAIALHNQMRRERLNRSVDVLLMTVGRLAEFRDNETSNHIERVRQYARLLATELKRTSRYSEQVTDEMIENIYRAAPMHDIGKVGIPDSILCKPDKLTDEEYRAMQEHCRIGREVVESAVAETGPVPILTMCATIAASHHEKWDGTGYPEELSGEDIPLPARIIALVDAYDAITSKRRYKEATTHQRAVEIIKEDAGTHFDPELIEPFLRCAEQFDKIRRTNADNEPSFTQALIPAIV